MTEYPQVGMERSRTAGKCATCPLLHEWTEYWDHLSSTDYEWCPLGLDEPGDENWDNKDCHLTPANQRIIIAMIAGEWQCDTCIASMECEERSYPNHACELWVGQPRKDDGE